MREAVEGRLGLRSAGEATADALVRGRIVRYDPSVPMQIRPGEGEYEVTRYQVQIAVDVEIVDQRDGRPLWQRRGLLALGEYQAPQEAQGRKLALEKLVDEIEPVKGFVLIAAFHSGDPRLAPWHVQRGRPRATTGTALGRRGSAARTPAEIVERHARVAKGIDARGDGEPPEDAAQFWQAVVHGNSLDLRRVKYSVLALGNKTFDHFCKCGRDFDLALERHGATRMYPRVDCDVD